MLTGGSIANVSSEIATVTFTVKEKLAPPLAEIMEGVALAGTVGGISIPTAAKESVQEVGGLEVGPAAVSDQLKIEMNDAIANMNEQLVKDGIISTAFQPETTAIQIVSQYKSDTIQQMNENIMENAITKALEYARDAPAIEALQRINQEVSDGQIERATITSVHITNVLLESSVNGDALFVAKIEKSIQAEQTMGVMEVIEVVPEHLAETVGHLFFPDTQPTILQKDPILLWEFYIITENETKSIAYFVLNKTIEKDETITIINGRKAGEKIEEIPSPFEIKKIDFKKVSSFLVLLVILGVLLHKYIKKYKVANKDMKGRNMEISPRFKKHIYKILSTRSLHSLVTDFKISSERSEEK